MPIVKIEDIRDTWSVYPVHLKDFDSEVRKRFKGQWRKLLNKWIRIEDGNGRLTCNIRLIQRDGKLYPELRPKEDLVNIHAGILFHVLKKLIQKKQLSRQ